MSTSGKIETKLKKMGLESPPTHPYPKPNRTSAVQVGNLLFLSGRGTGRQAMPLNIKQYGKVGGAELEIMGEFELHPEKKAVRKSVKSMKRVVKSASRR